MQFGGSRKPEGSRCSHAGRRREFRDERLEILLVQIERKCENDDPHDDAPDETEPLVAPDGAKHIVIVFGERMYLVKCALQFRIHVISV